MHDAKMSEQLKDGFAGLVIQGRNSPNRYTILRLRISQGPGKFFYEATTVPIATADIASAKATHTMKILLLTDERARSKEKEMFAEFETNKYIYKAGRRYDTDDDNHICGEIASCAVEFIGATLNGMRAAIIVYEALTGNDLFDFREAVMRKLEANPLVRRATRFSYVEFVLRMASDLCHMFHKLNSYGIFHGDIKPENIFVEHDEADSPRPIPASLKLYAIDFGLSCALPMLVRFVDIPQTTLCKPDASGMMRYGGTPQFLDPNATAKKAKLPDEIGRMRVTEEDAFYFFQTFETYSVGKTIVEFLEPSIFSHTIDRTILEVVGNLVAEMTGGLTQRKQLAVYGSMFDRLFEYAQDAHFVELGVSPIDEIDLGYETPKDESESESSERLKKKREILQIVPRKPNENDDDNNEE